MCWNYRGYGRSQSNWFQPINPYICKMDAERVLDFMLTKMKLSGHIAIYGRSLGGIASCHLANKYPNTVKVLLVDRTFSDFDLLSEARLQGKAIRLLFKLVSFHWKTLNDVNFTQAKCFKITTCDPKDDVVDNFAALNIGVAMQISRQCYKNSKWKLMFESLVFLIDIEQTLYLKLTDADKNAMSLKLQKGISASYKNHASQDLDS